MSEGINLEAVSSSLKAVKTLRSSVRDLFKLLSEGEVLDQGNNVKSESNQEPFLTEVKSLIENISTRLRELESSCTLIAHPSVSMNINLGNTGMLSQDPAFERTNLYSSLIASYRWNDKLQEYASHAYTILTANTLKRSHLGSLNSPLNMALRSRLPYIRQNIIGHNLSMQQIDNILHSIQRLFSDMTVEITRPFGAPVVLKITLERVLRAVILLRGLTSEWVLVKGLHEDFQTEDGKVDIWSESRYQVFRKVTENANAAMLHFYSPAHPDIALRSFVTWLHSYNSLFSKPCRKCEYRLQNSMPPTWRDYRHTEEYHELCRP